MARSRRCERNNPQRNDVRFRRRRRAFSSPRCSKRKSGKSARRLCKDIEAIVKLRDLGEGALIRKIREQFGMQASALPVGIGDDAAVIDLPRGHSLVFCSDLLAENTHFIRDLHPPGSVGHKAIAANVSDVAAMGGIAMHFLISLAAPGALDWVWFEGFFQGVESACRQFDISLVGGDSASSEHIFVDVSMIGRVRSGQAVRRSGAKVGDGIYVTGTRHRFLVSNG
jgi:thiamine-monophosphate kinase